jgi:hypothetical protein
MKLPMAKNLGNRRWWTTFVSQRRARCSFADELIFVRNAAKALVALPVFFSIGTATFGAADCLLLDTDERGDLAGLWADGFFFGDLDGFAGIMTVIKAPGYMKRRGAHKASHKYI